MKEATMDEKNQSIASEETEKTAHTVHLDENARTKAIADEEKKNEEGKQQENNDHWDLEREKLSKLIGTKIETKAVKDANAPNDEKRRSGLLFWDRRSSRRASDNRRTIGEAIERASGVQKRGSIFDLFVPSAEPEFMKGLGEEMKHSRYEDDNSTIATTETAAKEMNRSLLGGLYLQMALSGKSLAEEAENTSFFKSEGSDLPGTAPISLSSDESSVTARRASVFDYAVSHKLFKGFFHEAEATLEEAEEEEAKEADYDDDQSIFGSISIFSRTSTTVFYKQRSIFDTLKLEADATEVQVGQEQARMKLEREVERLQRVVKKFPITNVSKHLNGRQIHDVIPYLVRNPGLKRDFRQKIIIFKPTSEDEVATLLEKFLIDRAEEVDQYMTDLGVPLPDRSPRPSFTEEFGGIIKSVSGRILAVGHDDNEKKELPGRLSIIERVGFSFAKIVPEGENRAKVRRTPSIATRVLARFSNECLEDESRDHNQSYRRYSSSLKAGCYDGDGKVLELEVES